MKYTNIIYEKKGGIARITLNRPQVLNAMNRAMLEEMSLALYDVESNDEICVLIITGAGRAFCTGMDLGEVLRSGTTVSDSDSLPIPDNPASHPSICRRIRNLPVPTICAVNGYSITGGLELTVACDIILASENAQFGDTHARVGLLPRGRGLTQILQRRMAPNKAREMTFTGNFLSAQEAWHFGLVNRVVPGDDLQRIAEDMAREIVSCHQPTLRKLKYIMNEGEKTTLEVGLMLEAVVADTLRLTVAGRSSMYGLSQPALSGVTREWCVQSMAGRSPR